VGVPQLLAKKIDFTEISPQNIFQGWFSLCSCFGWRLRWDIVVGIDEHLNKPILIAIIKSANFSTESSGVNALRWSWIFKSIFASLVVQLCQA
jgi:hypothetical protein